MWETWKKGFFAWEESTARFAEQMLRNPMVLGPAGNMMTALMKVKAANEKAVATWVAAMGLPTRRDQERTLHSLNQIESALHDLQEQIHTLKN